MQLILFFTIVLTHKIVSRKNLERKTVNSKLVMQLFVFFVYVKLFT